MSLTAEQAKAVGANTSVTVLAGAGTGKTHMLSERYVHHLRQGYGPLEIVAVTFTERAAAELRARVRRAVQAESAFTPNVLVELEAAQISTIHALAARICRDHPVAAEVPADFGVLDDLERPVWLADQLQAALADLPDTVFDTLSYAQIAAAMTVLLDEPSAAVEAFGRGSGKWPVLIEQARLEAARRLMNGQAWQDAVQVLQTYAGSPEDLIEEARQVALRGCAALAEGAVTEALDHFGAISRRGGSAKRWPQGGFEDVKDALKVIKDRCTAATDEGLITLEMTEVDEFLAHLLPVLQDAFEQVHQHLVAAKRQARVLDFVDLELHALKALEHASVREHYQLRWRAFLIDEFQDTSPVQAELLRWLTEDVNVTLVGDEKQAIYGFRGADANVFQAFRERLNIAGAQPVELATSFRTHAELMTGLNTTFAPVLGDVHQDLGSWRTAPPHPGPHLTLHAVDAPKGVNKDQRRTMEARFIAKTVRSWMASGILVHDSDTNTDRPIRWDDVAVLTRTWAPLDVYSEVLTALDIPVVHSGGGNLLETREAKDGMLMIRFLADPHDDLALASLLRSPFFAVDDLTLYRFAQDLGKHETWWDGLQGQQDHGLSRAANVLSSLLANRRHVSPSRLLQQGDYRTGYSAVIAHLAGAQRRLADWEGFRTFVRRLEGGLADVFAVARQLKRLIASEIEVPRPTLAAQDAIALMTIHRAKGLEWPIVILADADYKAQTRAADTLADPVLGVALKLEDSEGESQVPALYKILKQRLVERENDEAKRVLYVGMTRARDRVLVTATQATGGGLELLASGLQDLGVLCTPILQDADEHNHAEPHVATVVPKAVSGDLWSRSPSALGLYARYTVSKDAMPKALPTAAELWDEVLLLVGEMDARWLPHLEKLQQADVPPPHPDTVFRELTMEGTVTVDPAICMWSTAEITVALVSEEVTEGPYDQRLVSCSVSDTPDLILAKVREAMAQI